MLRSTYMRVNGENPQVSGRRSDVRLLLGLVSFAALMRIIFLIYMPNVFSQEGESYSRINLMLAWLAQGKGYPDTNFGPMHTWFVYAVTLPFHNVVWPVRIAHTICGVLTVIPFFYMVRSMYGSSAAAWSSLCLGAFHTHLRATVTGLAEGPFILCLITGLCFAILAMEKKRPPINLLALSALFMNLAGAFRFEAWLYLPLICLFLFSRSASRAFLYGAMNLVFPLFHMFMCYRLAGEGRTLLDALSFARTSGTSFLQYMINLPLSYRLWAWPSAFWLALTPPMAVLCLIGLIWSLARAARGIARRNRSAMLGVLPALFLFNIAIFFYRAIKGTIDPAIYRYTLSMDLMLIPAAIWATQEAMNKLVGPRSLRPKVVAVIVFILIGWSIVAAVSEVKANAYPEDIQMVVKWVRENGRGERIIPDHDFHPYLLVESGLPQSSFRSLEWTGKLRNELNREKYQELLRDFRPTVLILDHDCNPDIGGNCVVFKFPRGGLGDVFEQDGLRFKRVLHESDYSIFRITPLEPNSPDQRPLDGQQADQG